MTIRLENLTIDSTDAAYLRATEGERDVTNDETYRFEILSLVRHIMRERNDCDIIPIVRAVTAGPTNEYGDNLWIEVTYSKRGFRAIYGAVLCGRITKVQCYMD